MKDIETQAVYTREGKAQEPYFIERLYNIFRVRERISSYRQSACRFLYKGRTDNKQILVPLEVYLSERRDQDMT